MHRYWITFDFSGEVPPLGLGYGCGVTAYDLDDAVDSWHRSSVVGRSRRPLRSRLTLMYRHSTPATFFRIWTHLLLGEFGFRWAETVAELWFRDTRFGWIQPVSATPGGLSFLESSWSRASAGVRQSSRLRGRLFISRATCCR